MGTEFLQKKGYANLQRSLLKGCHLVDKNVQRLESEQIRAIISPRAPNSFITIFPFMAQNFSHMSKEELKRELEKDPHKCGMLNAYKLRLDTLTPEQLEIAIGVMLGDACLQTQNQGKTYRMKFEQGAVHVEYIEHFY